MDVDNTAESAPAPAPAPTASAPAPATAPTAAAPAPIASAPAPASTPAAPVASASPPPSTADDEQETEPFYYVQAIQHAIDSHDDPASQLHLDGDKKVLPLCFNFVPTPSAQVWKWFAKLDKPVRVPKRRSRGSLSSQVEYQSKTHVSLLMLKQITSNGTYGVGDWQKALCTMKHTSNAKMLVQNG